MSHLKLTLTLSFDQTFRSSENNYLHFLDVRNRIYLCVETSTCLLSYESIQWCRLVIYLGHHSRTMLIHLFLPQITVPYFRPYKLSYQEVLQGLPASLSPDSKGHDCFFSSFWPCFSDSGQSLHKILNILIHALGFLAVFLNPSSLLWLCG